MKRPYYIPVDGSARTALPDGSALPPTLQGRKVVLVNHSDTLGEGASTTFRLMQALRSMGLDTRMVVYTRTSREPWVSAVSTRFLRGVRYCLERAGILAATGGDTSQLFNLSTGSCAVNIHRHPWVRQADIVCLGWINQGLVNLDGIDKLHRMGKHIVWAMHDHWPFTGLCHKPGACTYYRDSCGNCMYLNGGGKPGDLSGRMWERKDRLYSRVPLTFVAQSRWLESRARSSSLLRHRQVTSIPLPLNIEQYYTHPHASVEALVSDSKSKLLLVGSSHLDRNPEGLRCIIDALNHIFDNNPTLASNAMVYLVGHLDNPAMVDGLRMSHRWMGRINDPSILHYLMASATAVMSPSVGDGTPRFLIEAMASGAVPVTVDGLDRPTLIDHGVNGWTGRKLDTQHVAAGIEWACGAGIDRDAQHARVEQGYSTRAVAAKYISLFDHILTQ